MREITVIGFGNQGKAWAHNLRDSGWKVRVSGRAGGAGSQQAREAGFETLDPSDLRQVQGIVALLLPDEQVQSFFQRYLTNGVNRRFVFAHGFSVVFDRAPFSPSDDVILVAPKGIGTKLREEFVKGSGVMGVVGVDADVSGEAWQIADSIAEGLGLKRIEVVKSTFSEECKADLFSEQVILCGAAPTLVAKSIEFMVEQGIDRKIATYECLNELKLIADMMVVFGVDGMLKRVSRAAYWGGKKGAQVLFPEAELQSKMQKIWTDIDNGKFAEELKEIVREKTPSQETEKDPKNELSH